MKVMWWLLAAGPLALAGCGGEAPAKPAAGSAEASSNAAPAVQPTGKVLEVRMITDAGGSYFAPSEVTARAGDIVRFVLESGVHNASFPAGGRRGTEALPAQGPMLQLPGQTYDVTVDAAPGEYAFRCDPHAALGMTGTLIVAD